MSPPRMPGEGQLMVGTQTHVLRGGGIAEAGTDLLASFPFQDTKALGITLDLAGERLTEPVFLLDFATQQATQLQQATVTMAAGQITASGMTGSDMVMATVPEALILAGTTTISTQANLAFIDGELGAVTYHQLAALSVEHPEVDTLVLRDVPGSLDDESNLETGRLVRAKGYGTRVPDGGMIASGAVDLFTAGVRRSLEGTAMVGVHSWGWDNNTQGQNLPCNAPEHLPYLCYLTHTLGRDAGTSFYFFTLAAAPASGVHYMSAAEIDRFGLTTP